MNRKTGFFLCAAALLIEGVAPALWAAESDKEKTRSVSVVGGTKSNQDTAAAIALENPAGLAIEIVPGDHINIGAKVVFKVSTKKPGYLILIDIDARGRVTQIYPNLYSMVNPGGANMTLPTGASVATNLLKAGKTISIPDQNNPFARFEYIVEPPSGQGIIVALLSARPVHMVDIPDIPADSTDIAAAAHYVYDVAKTLRLAEPDAQLVDPQWSFEAKVYAISQ